jgi:hypothetical protein
MLPLRSGQGECLVAAVIGPTRTEDSGEQLLHVIGIANNVSLQYVVLSGRPGITRHTGERRGALPTATTVVSWVAKRGERHWL